MQVRREDLVNEARKWIGVKFGHQGRSLLTGLDCGGLILKAGQSLNLTELEYLGYANFPTEGKFEELLRTHAIETDFISTYPHYFTGTELLPGDLLSFDYGNGEGVRHVALVSNWDGRSFWIIDSQPDYGVSEHPFVVALNLHLICLLLHNPELLMLLKEKGKLSLILR
jgi:hypothetical protein